MLQRIDHCFTLVQGYTVYLCSFARVGGGISLLIATEIPNRRQTRGRWRMARPRMRLVTSRPGLASMALRWRRRRCLCQVGLRTCAAGGKDERGRSRRMRPCVTTSMALRVRRRTTHDAPRTTHDAQCTTHNARRTMRDARCTTRDA